MADNTPQNGTATIAADDVGSGVLVQRVKPVHGPDGSATDTSTANPLPTVANPPADTTQSATLTSAGSNSFALAAGLPAWHAAFTGTFTGTTAFDFQGSMDGGTTWFSVPAAPRGTIQPTPVTAVTAGLYALPVRNFTGDASGLTHVRINSTGFQAGDSVTVNWLAGVEQSSTILTYLPAVGPTAVGGTPATNPLYVAGNDGTNVRAHDLRQKGTQGSYFLSAQDAKDTGRALVQSYWERTAGGTTEAVMGTATAQYRGAGIGSPTADFTVSSGKTLRIQTITITLRNSTTTALTNTRIRLLVAASAPTTSNNSVWSTDLAGPTAATAELATTYTFNFPDGLEIGATLHLNFSHRESVATGTVTINLQGYEY